LNLLSPLDPVPAISNTSNRAHLLDVIIILVFRCDWAKYFADLNLLMAQKYQCTICGYIYDPEKGDPDSKIAPGTSFADLPETWTCPQCGAAKDDFKEIKS
jgi:rubredoxin